MPSKFEEDSLEYYFKNIENLPKLGREEERELLKRAKSGDKEAIEKLIYANLKTVISMAKRYKGSGVPVADLINEGNIALLNAIKYFDLKRNTRFATYAIWWIRQAIMKTLSEQRKDIRVAYSASAKAKMLTEIEKTLSHERGGNVTLQEVAEEAGMSEAEASKLFQKLRREVSLESLQRAGESHSNFPEFLTQDALPSPYREIEREELKKIIKQALNTLRPKERYIVMRHFGLDGKEPETLADIARRLGFSRERCSQLKKRALKKLKNRFGETFLKYIYE